MIKFRWIQYLKHFLFGSLILLMFFLYFLALVIGSVVLTIASLIMLVMTIKASEDADKMLI